MDEYIGIIKVFCGNFAPRGWAFCDGSLLPISQYQAVFAILGTTYGGDGQTNFALPDLRCRIPVGMGTGPGLSPIDQGEMSGTENVTLLSTQIPAHQHQLAVSSADSTQTAATANVSIATPGSGSPFVSTFGFNTSSPDTALNPTTINISGGNTPHNNMQPYLGINYIICLEGIFPSHN